MRNVFAFLILNFSYLISFAQYPNTEIWLLDIKQENGTFKVENPVNITNRDGYDNQPSFSPDGKYIFYSSYRNDQTDIYKYHIATKQTTQFCTTPESEFSPTFTPDGKYTSAILIEKDSTQRLWKFPLKGGQASLVADKIDSVGYHCWINKEKLAFFVLTKPFTLQIADLKTQATKTIDDSIGRCIKMIPGRNALSYTVKTNDTTCFIRQHKFDTKPSKTNFDLVMKNFKTIHSSEDYVWINNNTLIMANGSVLYSSCVDCKNEDGPWKLIVDLKQYGIDNIGRLALSADGKKLALVTTTK